MRAHREGPVVSLPRSDGKTVDVFTGKGWENHAVFEVNEGKIRFVKGRSLSDVDFKKFKTQI